MKNQPKYFGEVILFIVTILWGATFVIIKESLNDSSAMLFIAARFSIAGILLIPFLVYKKINFTKNGLLSGILLGIILFAGFATQTIGLKYTSATKSGFLTGTAVVMIPFLQIFIEKKRPSNGAIIGTILVVIGIFLMSSGGHSIAEFVNDIGKNFNYGDALTLFCAFFFALYVVYLDVLSKKYDFIQLLFLQITVTALLGFLFSELFSSTNLEAVKFSITRQLLIGLIYTSLFATLITTALQTKYQKLVTPTKAGIIYSFEPIFAALFAFIIAGERIGGFGYLGAALIFGGLLFSEIHDKVFSRWK